MNSSESFSRHLDQSITKQRSYDAWAITYDEEVLSVDYKAPHYVALTALRFSPIGTFLDVGCGTGLVGEEIRRHALNDVIIDGCDFSQEMLAVVSKKQVYRSLVCCDIFSMPFQAASYDVVTAAGVFAGMEDRLSVGDPDYQAIPNITHILKPGGYFIFTISSRVWKTDPKEYEVALANAPIRLIEILERPYHNVIPTMLCLVLQKIRD